MIKIVKDNESYAFIDCDSDQAKNISDSESFCFYAPGYIWSPKYKSGIWDGKIRLFNIKSRLIIQGLVPKLIQYFKDNNISYKLDTAFNIKGVKLTDKWINEFVNDALQCKFKPRDYQIEALKRIIYKRKSITLLPTGSGKSFVFYIVVNILKFLDPDRKILMIVPSTNLVEQMSSDFNEYAEHWCDYSENVHKIYSGKDKNTDKFLTISTWQSLQNIKERFWFQQWDTVLVDEVHTANTNKSGGKSPGNVLSNIISKCVNADFRVGMTGSLAESGIDKLQLVGLFGKIKKIIKTKKLIDDGFLSNLNIKCFILEHSKEEKMKAWRMSFQNENEFLRGSKFKLSFIKKLALGRKGNTLILFKSIEYGKLLVKIIEDAGKIVYYVDGSISTEVREDIRKLTETGKDVVIVASYGCFSVGVNIKNLEHLIFAESMKSSIKIIQSIGRILRKHNNKKIATVYDIVDDLTWRNRKNFCLKHFFRRKEIYKADDFDFITKRYKIGN